jgi:RNA polymerase sigma factor (sigma-70 family)
VYSRPPDETATRFGPAIAVLAAHERAFRRTARRHSLCADDAEDAYQHAVEILLVKGPLDDAARLAPWMHTVTKHEAIAIRKARERLLGGSGWAGAAVDGQPLELVPEDRPGPVERAERAERVARSAEALAGLKPQERRALALKAEGYSYVEIRELTGWTYTKVNRCMAEGRKRFLELFGAIEEGRRCEEIAPAVASLGSWSLNGDDEGVRRHLRACPRCRADAKRRKAVGR